MAKIFSSIILVTFMLFITNFSMKTTSADTTAKSEQTSYPSECQYPCVPQPTPPVATNCPPPLPSPAAPSPPSGSGGYSYPPPPPPAPPGYYYNPPFPYYPSPQSYGSYYGPPPPNPILPYFPFYFKSPPPPPGFSSANALKGSIALIPCLVVLFCFHFILLGGF